MDELSRLRNGVAFGLEKRITKPPVSQKKADLREVLKDLAPSDFPSMQADVETFYKKLKNNTDLKLKKYSKNMKDWYTESFVYPEPPKEVTKSDGKPTVKKEKKKKKTYVSRSNLSYQEYDGLKFITLSKL